MSAIVADIRKEVDKAEDWVEKEVGLIEHRITTTKTYHSAEHIAAKIDGWFTTLDTGLDAETRKYYAEAALLIKKLF